MSMRSMMITAALAGLWAWPTSSAGQSILDPGLSKACPPAPCTDCANTPFVPTNCMTTPCGPARANIVIGTSGASPNMLWCPGGRPYALCFFSGPPKPTGKPQPGHHNKPLPCVWDAEAGIADCACQVYNSGSYYVDINSILNRNAFYEAQQDCGPDGSGCKNMRDCDTNGASKPGTTCPSKVATVCTYINNQGSGDPSTWLYPAQGTADLVSTFSFAMSPTPTGGPYVLGSTPCNGLYAGCMTAPCKYRPGSNSAQSGDIVHCACPTWNGNFQVGQNGQTCQLNQPDVTFVWSAANTVASTSGSSACTPSQQ